MVVNLHYFKIYVFIGCSIALRMANVNQPNPETMIVPELKYWLSQRCLIRVSLQLYKINRSSRYGTAHLQGKTHSVCSCELPTIRLQVAHELRANLLQVTFEVSREWAGTFQLTCTYKYITFVLHGMLSLHRPYKVITFIHASQ